jgi:hypothetical protein
MHTQLAVTLTLAGLLFPASSAYGQSPLPDVQPEFVVNTFTAGNQTAPAVAASASGTVWIAWIDKGQQLPAIKARRFGPSGAPLSPEIPVHLNFAFPNALFAGPAVSATAGGGCVVAWAESPNVWFRRFDGNGAPLGDEQRIAPSASFEAITFPGVAVAADGSFVVAWLQSDLLNDVVQVQRFDPQGKSLGAIQAVATASRNTLSSPRLAGAPDGGFLVVWQDAIQGIILARRYDATGAGSAAARVDVPGTGYASGPAAALAGDGSARVVWLAAGGVWIRSLSAAGQPVGPGVPVGLASISFQSPAVAVDHDGNALVVGSDFNLVLQARLVKDDLTPISGVFPASDPAFLATDPALATTASGDLVLAWSSGFQFTGPFFPQPATPGRDGDGEGIAARIFAPLRCAAGSGVLCLGPDHRFEAHVTWKNPDTGETGSGTSLPLTADTGAFWFFGDQNLELMVKVLDGTAVNGHFWVYGGSLSNVEYTLTVTDTLAGSERSYHNPAGQFASFADVGAFPSAAPAGTAPAASKAAVPAVTSPAIATAAPLVGCLPVVANPTSLCLASGHFTVSVQFTDPRTGLAGAATAVPLTDDTGAFWFFDDSNLELMVKVLDGRAINGKFWVFYGALSDVDYTITVSRPETGEAKTYHNPRGTLASRGDTQAF